MQTSVVGASRAAVDVRLRPPFHAGGATGVVAFALDAAFQDLFNTLPA